MPSGLLDTSWKIAKPADVSQILSDDLLSSASINATPAAIALESHPSLSAADVTFNLDEAMTVTAFNSEDDQDRDGLLMPARAATADNTAAPAIVLSPGRAWLKYRVEAELKATGGASRGAIGFDLSAGGRVVLSDYRVHDPGERVRAALLHDLSTPRRLAAVLDHVQQLQPGDAIAMQMTGTLKASATVSWTDVFCGRASALMELLGTATPLTVQIQAGLQASVHVTVADDFVVVFAKEGSGAVRAVVRKARSRAVAADVAAKVEAGWVDPAGVTNAAGPLLNAVLGRPYADVKSILDHASLADLSAGDQEFVRALGRRLLGTDVFDRLDTVRARVVEIHDRLPQALEEAARAKVELGFSYEYARISEQESLIDVVLNADALAKCHQPLVRGRIDDLTSAITQSATGIELRSYLNRKTITTEKAWGFTLGIGKWVSIGGKDVVRRSWTERINERGTRQMAFLGTRAYKGSWVGEKRQWTLDVRADMPRFSRDAVALANEFDFGFNLAWYVDDAKLSRNDLSEWLDLAALWGVVSQADEPQVRDSLASGIEQPCEVVVQMTVPAGAVRAMLPALASRSLSAWASPLAAGMPWMNDCEGRRNVGARRDAYAPLWEYELQHPRTDARELQLGAANWLEKNGHPDLALLEKIRPPESPFTFSGLIFLNGPAAVVCQTFTNGADRLLRAIERNEPAGAIEQAAGYMQKMAEQSHHFRALGAYLCECAQTSGVLPSVARTLTLTLKKGGSFVVRR